jgi:chromosome segregation ATPase
LSGTAKQVVAHGERLAQMAAGSQTGNADFDEVIVLLQGPLDYVNGAQDDLSVVTADLQDAADVIGSLLAEEKLLERTVAPLRFTRTMLATESANLAHDVREKFTGLTEGIGVLHDRIQLSLRGHFQALSDIHETLKQTVEALKRKSQDHGLHLDARQKQIGSSLGRLTQVLARNDTREVKLSKRSRQLADAVSRAVVGLQAHDIVSQKLDHAQAGIRELVEALGQCRRGDRAALSKVPALARIQAAQLDEILGDICRSENTLLSAIGRLGEELQALDDECLMLKEFDEITASVNGTIQVLLDNLSAARELVSEVLETSGQAETLIQPAGEAAAHLTDNVEQVAQEMRRIALNMQVQAVQTGSGTGLEVLAAHTSTVSDEISAISRRAAARVSETARKLREDIGRLSRIRETGVQEKTVLDSRSGLQESRLNDFREQTLAEVRYIGEALQQARRLGTGMLASIDLQPALRAVKAARDQVADFREATSLCDFPSSGDELAVSVTGIEGRYTMTSERVVHHRILEEMGQRPEAALQRDADSAPVQQSPEAGEFGSGVELF